jgi:hypothetical protein
MPAAKAETGKTLSELFSPINNRLPPTGALSVPPPGPAQNTPDSCGSEGPISRSMTIPVMSPFTVDIGRKLSGIFSPATPDVVPPAPPSTPASEPGEGGSQPVRQGSLSSLFGFRD